MDGFAGIQMEHEPGKRPRVLSERISDRRAWLVAGLKRGYSQSAHTNVQWDASAQAAFAAYADFARVSTDTRKLGR